MDPERERIQDDLRGLVSGQVMCDDIHRQLYASDGSIYQIRPIGVVRPRHTADVVACVQYANEHQIPIHARGAGTGLAGESLGPGLVLDFSHGMRRILSVDEDQVRVQPGVVRAMLNQHLRPFGRFFAPDPATSDVTTLGSMIAIDASGSRWLRYGSCRHHVRSLQAVLGDGTVMEMHRHPVFPVTDDGGEPGRDRLVSHLAELIGRNAELIQQRQPRTPVNRSGYRLDGVLKDGHLDLAGVVVGSEGTLAVVTEATLSTEPVIKHRGVVLLLFSSLERAARAVLEILPLKPSACDLMDRRHLSLARESDVRYELLIPAEAEAVLLVEQDGASSADVRERLMAVVSRVRDKTQLAAGAHLATEMEDLALYWQLARKYVPTLSRMRGMARPTPFVEDMAVPPESLPLFLVRMQNALKRHHVTASLFGHAGHGQLHLRPLLDMNEVQDVARMEGLANDLYAEVMEVGGTISGEHSDGLSRTPFLRQQFGPLVDVFAEVKRLFDPLHVLNPGKIVARRPMRLTDKLRPHAQQAPAQQSTLSGPPLYPLRLHWKPGELSETAVQCNGCGTCRSQSPDVRMCPIFRFQPREESSPRAKANLLRGLLAGELPQMMLTQDEFKRVCDLCVHCHMCRLECPAGVDIPKLVAEGKGAYVATNGLRPTDWLLTRVDWVSSAASRLRPLANWAIANPSARWVMEKFLGIAQGRKLPRLARRTFLQRAVRRRLVRPVRTAGAKVMFFVDTYANYYDPELGQALVAVLEHNTVGVYVHPRQRHSAMAMIAQGALDAARRVARHNVEILAEAVRQGFTIVCSEPSAALALTREYVHLLDDDDARLVADNTMDACHYLWKRHQQGKLELDFHRQNLSVVYHAPCHLKALEVGLPGVNLLRLVPGLSVRPVERGCSGMAGTFGIKRENYRNSLRAGWGLISALRESVAQAGATECSTCKMQMEQGASVPVVHPLKLLALAYGFMPEIARHWSSPRPELVVT